MEIWGGIECTINRVGNHYFDQLDYQQHYQRPEDIDLLINLGIKKVRYPILWEKHGNEHNTSINWGVIGDNLDRLHNAGVEVIAGLVHHGSGPSYVDIRENSFAESLASFAKAVAIRFPWITYYTPINEPVTTARFCGLYGLWYPHDQSMKIFLRILINECRATVLAMKAIREVNSSAKLIQTEDLGKTHSTEVLQYQAEFENHRKWLGIDLLCGKVDQTHPLWRFIINHEITIKELKFFSKNPCVPAILGFNYYITSERYLDENIDVYPSHLHGGNGVHRYADVEAVRCANLKISGLKVLLIEAWKRYSLPMAVTEAHLSCGREDQLRWLNQIWNWANELIVENIRIEGITIWSLFGAHGWNRLLTEPKGNYESGAFDISSGERRLTAIGNMVRELANSGNYKHPVLAEKGWWDRENRIIYPTSTVQSAIFDTSSCSPILVIGSTGTLGAAFTRKLAERNIYALSLNRSQLNVTDLPQIMRTIEKHKPWAIINAAGFVDVDNAETRKEDCFLSNTVGAANLAQACQSYGIKLVTFSTDLVFDGKKNAEYIETDNVNPLNIYGLSKAHAEEQVTLACKEALILRTCAFFGPWDQYNFVSNICTGLKNNTQMNIANDVYISPTYIPDLVDMTIDLLIDNEKGIWHLSNQGTISWYDLAKQVAERKKYNLNLLHPIPLSNLGLQAPRPSFSALKSCRGTVMPSLENALDRLFNQPEIKYA